MAYHLRFEQYYWFDAEYWRILFPNASTLAHHLEISTKTARRKIDFMCHRLGAPLGFDGHHKEYPYTKSCFALPPFKVCRYEFLTTLLAQNLHSLSAGEAFSALCNGPVESETFRIVTKARLKRRKISCNYFSLTKSRHLKRNMGEWVPLARCLEQNDWCKYHRIRELSIARGSSLRCCQKLAATSGGRLPNLPEWNHMRPPCKAFRARWVVEEQWNAGKSISEERVGSAAQLLGHGFSRGQDAHPHKGQLHGWGQKTHSSGKSKRLRPVHRTELTRFNKCSGWSLDDPGRRVEWERVHKRAMARAGEWSDADMIDWGPS